MSNWATDRPAGASRVWGVAALVQAVGDTLSARFSSCVVKGEISGFTRAASGHGYFTLKDEHGNASLRCAMFRRALSQVDFSPSEGMLVEARGNLAVYEARGELQFVVEGMQRAGAGALYEQFLRLKARLEAEGLFDADRKRMLPRFPRRVAVVTSLGAAALRDVLTALRRRSPHVEVVLSPCSVQGVEAPAQIVQALTGVILAHRAGQFMDAVIVCRGGGSLEDLWSFNDERVVRAIAACPIPVVCGVGHETDFTLADFAADLRAPTPTAAAELVAQDRETSLDQLDAAERHLQHRVHQRLDNLAQRLDQAAVRMARPAQVVGQHRQALSLLEHRMLAACQDRVRRSRQLLPQWQQRLTRAVSVQQARHQHSVQAWDARLGALNPHKVLERGFAWLTDEAGAPMTRASQARPQAQVRGVMADGVLHMHVTQVELDATPGSDRGD
ncbi:MAG TPA: exodeoxyribonuclease VII large subunit [Aquabacterium sp.]|uniref:exodeoxyribonuclease VII large subunit n=1 Tax=Aquabacterium sp. TaxID=1872578 RepID=UPI002E2F8830|nr:exodeoxyribonuclease VII large subunit [Aquabacterium sp.]HEX5358214.1 exodeoxyribonuclease VII large subunit [Aquabacterium sp.]